jgi:alkane 1-monooxygenase
MFGDDPHMTISTWFSRRAPGGRGATPADPQPVEPAGPAARSASAARNASRAAPAAFEPVYSDADDDATLSAVVAALARAQADLPEAPWLESGTPPPAATAFRPHPDADQDATPVRFQMGDVAKVRTSDPTPAGTDDGVPAAEPSMRAAEIAAAPPAGPAPTAPSASATALDAPVPIPGPVPLSGPKLDDAPYATTVPDTPKAPAEATVPVGTVQPSEDPTAPPPPELAPVAWAPMAAVDAEGVVPDQRIALPVATPQDAPPSVTSTPDPALAVAPFNAQAAPVQSCAPADAEPVPTPTPANDDGIAAAIRAAADAPVPGDTPGGSAKARRATARSLRALGTAFAAAQAAGRAFWSAAPAMRAFALATLAPVPLLLGAAFLGGPLPWLALAYLTVFTFAMDELSAFAAPAPHPTASSLPDQADRDRRAADRLSVILAATHFLMLATAILALSGGTGLSAGGWLATLLAFGLWFGQVSNANAHELIHRADPRLRALGAAVFTSLLFGHHASAHRLVHHRHVATPDDPNSAEAGEGFWQFLPRAWAGSFLAGWEMERQMMRARIGRRRQRINPYFLYIGGAVVSLAGVALIFGLAGAFAYLALAFHAQLQLLLSDFVQHYGLARRRLASGRYEPVGPQHSWDAPEGLSAIAMLNAARHGDHHARPSRPAASLQRGAARTPVLPHSLPIMCTIALWPPLWHRMMDARVAALRPRTDGLRL